MSRNKPKRLSLKERYHILRQAGYTSKESEYIRNQSDDNVIKAINHKRKENNLETFKPKSFLKEYRKKLQEGESVKDIVKEIFQSEPLISKPKQPTKSGGRKLLLLWKDVTDNVGREFMNDVLDDTQQMNVDYLRDSINGWKNMDFGEIGQGIALIVQDEHLSMTKRMYPGYEQVYYGTGKRYGKLLEKINFLMLGIYQAVKKRMFLREIVNKLSIINPESAERLTNDFNITRR